MEKLSSDEMAGCHEAKCGKSWLMLPMLLVWLASFVIWGRCPEEQQKENNALGQHGGSCNRDWKRLDSRCEDIGRILLVKPAMIIDHDRNYSCHNEILVAAIIRELGKVIVQIEYLLRVSLTHFIFVLQVAES